ncbi:Crp/Fnr family transcriptional regulator [Pedobacter cryoconitis]|uniref:CRP-like cAMP-binding protein n=1 Tax=Pedobacter cryoconitis TaxID=188932 RepID=A0A7X0J236_9SPHI|nr:Crp/Fnr family transcriptional regulator [Pedobacter cryoconitis]MBB6499515.1 CRP-like cAMP-binding protein [Pedobacter cryoconitis]
MQNTLETIKNIYPLKEQHLNLLLQELSVVELPKNHLIIKADKVERSLYFIETGVARAYVDGRDNRITFWFGMEGDIILSYHSYVNNKPGYESIELLEDCLLYELKTEALEQLYNTHTELANWGRKLAELILIKTEESYIGRLFKPAKERYIDLLQTDPLLIQRIPLGHIASYLGVTQVTLSRIRAEVR